MLLAVGAMCLVVPVVMVEINGSVPDEMTVWITQNPAVMDIWRARNYQMRFLTPEFRKCLEDGVVGSSKPFEIRVALCESFERFRQTQEEERAMVAELMVKAKKERDDAEALALKKKHQEEIREKIWKEREPDVIRKWLGAVLGYQAAVAEDNREEAKAEIAKQKKYSRYGGVVDRFALYESQQKIRESDEEIERLRGLAKDNEVKLLGRNHKALRRAEECIVKELDDEDCHDIRRLYAESSLR